VSYLRRLELTKSVMIVGSAPASISGIASALAPVALQVCLFSPIKLSSKAVQIGCVMDLAVQAGLLTIKPGGLNNYTNLQAAFWLQLGWVSISRYFLFCSDVERLHRNSCSGMQCGFHEGADMNRNPVNTEFVLLCLCWYDVVPLNLASLPCGDPLSIDLSRCLVRGWDGTWSR